MPQTQQPAARRFRFGRPAQITLAICAVLVLVVTGYAWHSLDSLRSNLTTAGGLGLGGKKDGATDILMVGLDSRTDAQGNPLPQKELDMLRAGDETATNTDTIVLIRVPNDGSSATAISIPRDSYVDVPGVGMSKINAAYGATKAQTQQKLQDEGESPQDAEKASTKAGRQALIKSVANLTGITVDHYAEVGLLGFVLLTNAVGGVDVCLANPVNEPLSGAHFPAGEQTLNGPNALSFVRQRHDLPRGDLDRIVRQQVFMASLAHKVLSAGTLSNPGKISQLTDAVHRSIVLDSDWDVVKFAQQLQNLAGGAIHFQTIPVVDSDATTDDGQSIVKVNPTQVRDWTASLVGKKSSGDKEPTTTKPAPPRIDPATVTVDVANDTGTSGLAASVSSALASMGYGQGTVSNDTGAPVDGSEVLAPSTTDAGGAAVAAALGGLPVHADSTLTTGSVRVILADDYAGPGSNGSGASGSDGSYGSSSSSSESSGSGSSGSGSASSPSTSSQPTPPITAGGSGPKCVN